MIVESVVLGLTTIICSSLWFTDRFMKREKQHDDEENKSLEEPTQPLIELRPFLQVKRGATCPACGISRTIHHDNREDSSTLTGMVLPTVCPDTKKCSAGYQPHLHCRCGSCGASWMMATKDGK